MTKRSSHQPQYVQEQVLTMHLSEYFKLFLTFIERLVKMCFNCMLFWTSVNGPMTKKSTLEEIRWIAFNQNLSWIIAFNFNFTKNCFHHFENFLLFMHNYKTHCQNQWIISKSISFSLTFWVEFISIYSNLFLSILKNANWCEMWILITIWWESMMNGQFVFVLSGMAKLQWQEFLWSNHIYWSIQLCFEALIFFVREGLCFMILLWPDGLLEKLFLWPQPVNKAEVKCLWSHCHHLHFAAELFCELFIFWHWWLF